ncbi:MAG: hypothetical protein FJ050_06375 [Cyanobacteria bacterium M_surface_7_m2_040]|nr:hypothetical protein [Cyanobacteria bacterium M_surface_7_m2_040]
MNPPSQPAMPRNVSVLRCIGEMRGALVFRSPMRARGSSGWRVQIIDVFSLQIATGYTRDPQGRLLLESQPSLAAGRSWSVAKAAQLIRNDARPHRWVALELDKRAWGLFWAGGGLQLCRQMLAERLPEAEACSALVPATPEALLKLVLDLGIDPSEHATQQPAAKKGFGLRAPPWPPQAVNPWSVVAWTSLVWLTVLGITAAGFLSVLERQDRKLQLLLERTAPATTQQ